MQVYLVQAMAFMQTGYAWPVWFLAFVGLIRLTVQDRADRWRLIAMGAACFFLLYIFRLILVKYFHVDPQKLSAQFAYNPADPLLFNSAFFLYFFTLFLLFFLLVHRQKLTRVVVFSVFSLFFFYKACGWYVIFILIAAVVDYFLSNAIYRMRTKQRKTVLLIFSLILNLGLLAFFKYTNFYIEIVNQMADGHIDPLHLILPVGISFYTFENLSYTIDVYRGHFKPVRNFFDYLFFLSFFPKLMMGPIVRASDFVPQIRKDIHVTREDIAAGLYLILSGLFRKVVISDFIWLNFGQYIFDDPAKHSGVECLFGVYCYALVIYCDFSGYSDMAIGMARWMGFRIPANFNSPYQSANITEFWRRWHISLSSWLRDYLYIPLGGSRGAGAGTWILFAVFFGGAGIATGLAAVNGNWWPTICFLFVLGLIFLPALLFKKERHLVTTSLNQMHTMLLGGLWHGASWNFLFWGFLHGIALSFDKFQVKMRATMSQQTTAFFDRAYNGLAFICGGFIFVLIARVSQLIFRKKLPDLNGKKFLGILLTFHFVCFGWIFFKAGSFAQAAVIISQIVNNFAPETFSAMVIGYKPVFLLMGIGFVLHFLPGVVEAKTIQALSRFPVYGKIAVLVSAIWILIQAKQSEQMLPIYLQF
ncbi:MAG TPA: MBOAT family O-acyltransferase [Bacteroidia bacterium]|nr:MBOAT family O-acyltransferase [Bacteroidia bacterium]